MFVSSNSWLRVKVFLQASIQTSKTKSSFPYENNPYMFKNGLNVTLFALFSILASVGTLVSHAFSKLPALARYER